MAALALEVNILHQEAHLAPSSFTQISIKYTLPKGERGKNPTETPMKSDLLCVRWPTHKNVQFIDILLC